MVRRKRALPAGLPALALAGAGAVTATAERHPKLGQPTSKAPEVPVVDCQTRLQLVPGGDPPSLRGRNYIAVGR